MFSVDHLSTDERCRLFDGCVDDLLDGDFGSIERKNGLDVGRS